MEVHSLQGGAPPGKEHYVYIASLRNAPGQGAQILRNETYLRYAVVTKDAAERRSWIFHKAITRFGFKVNIRREIKISRIIFKRHASPYEPVLS